MNVHSQLGRQLDLPLGDPCHPRSIIAIDVFLARPAGQTTFMARVRYTNGDLRIAQSTRGPTQAVQLALAMAQRYGADDVWAVMPPHPYDPWRSEVTAAMRKISDCGYGDLVLKPGDFKNGPLTILSVGEKVLGDGSVKHTIYFHEMDGAWRPNEQSVLRLAQLLSDDPADWPGSKIVVAVIDFEGDRGPAQYVRIVSGALGPDAKRVAPPAGPRPKLATALDDEIPFGAEHR